jgi:hypothetical protein
MPIYVRHTRKVQLDELPAHIRGNGVLFSAVIGDHRSQEPDGLTSLQRANALAAQRASS